MATQVEIAGHCDLSERQVRDLQKQLGLPSRDADLDAFRVAYIRHLRAVASRHKSETGGLDLTQERAALARAQREKTEIEIARLRGELIPAADVAREAFDMARTVRDRILALPNRMADRLVSETDRFAIYCYLTDELRGALESLANGEGTSTP